MKVKNISGKDLNLKGGLCKAGDTATVEFGEAKFLFSQNFVEQVTNKPAPERKVFKKTAKTDG